MTRADSLCRYVRSSSHKGEQTSTHQPLTTHHFQLCKYRCGVNPIKPSHCPLILGDLPSRSPFLRIAFQFKTLEGNSRLHYPQQTIRSDTDQSSYLRPSARQKPHPPSSVVPCSVSAAPLQLLVIAVLAVVPPEWGGPTAMRGCATLQLVREEAV
jgi:hypothetical protein